MKISDYLKNFSGKSVIGTSLIFLLSTGCIQKKETVIDRQAPSNMADSMKVTSLESSDKILIINKESLGKAFIMIPQLLTTDRKPQFMDFKPMIVAFEKSGSSLGLFLLQRQNIYDSIPADRLLQPFSIVSETEKTISISLKDGFKSFIPQSHMNIVEQGTLATVKKGVEGSLDIFNIQDAFVKKADSGEEEVFIEEAIRAATLTMDNPAYFTKKKENESDQFQESIPKEISVKTMTESSILRLSIKPYKINSGFTTKLHDVHLKAGYFINYATKVGEDAIIPQIIHWDTHPNKGPITVALEDTIPEDQIEVIISGVKYWNKYFDREIFVFKKNVNALERMSDRSIFIRWLDWKSAGFAYASAQADPLTGETLRAQIYMTSSWLKYAQSSFDHSQVDSLQKTKDSLQDIRGKGFCLLEQSDFLKNNFLQFAQHPVSLSVRKKASDDTIRLVVAHEMGHVMGLRHNFSGSAFHEGTDEEMMAAEKEYLKDENHPGFSSSSTVMDYLDSLNTAVLGRAILQKTLFYDQAAIDFGYGSNTEDSSQSLASRLPENSYCSDEHIYVANKSGFGIYGCERFDGFKSPFKYEKSRFLMRLKNYYTSNVSVLFEILRAKNYYTEGESPDTIIQRHFGLDSNFGSVHNLVELFQERNNQKSYILPENILSYNKRSVLDFENTVSELSSNSYKNLLGDDIKTMGGLAGLINEVMMAVESSDDVIKQSIEQSLPEYKAKLSNEFHLSSHSIELFEKLSRNFATSYKQQLLRGVLSSFLPYMPQSMISNWSKTYWLNSSQLGELAQVLEKYIIIEESKESITIGENSINISIYNISNENLSSLKDDYWPSAMGMGSILNEVRQKSKLKLKSGSLEIIRLAYLAKVEENGHVIVSENQYAKLDLMTTVELKLFLEALVRTKYISGELGYKLFENLRQIGILEKINDK